MSNKKVPKKTFLRKEKRKYWKVVEKAQQKQAKEKKKKRKKKKKILDLKFAHVNWVFYFENCFEKNKCVCVCVCVCVWEREMKSFSILVESLADIYLYLTGFV